MSGIGAEILRVNAEAATQRVNAALAGFSADELREIASEAVKTLPRASADFFANSDPAKSRVLRGLMADHLRKAGERARGAICR